MNVRIALVLAVCLALAIGANATTITDDFQTDPFAASADPRWCERWHEVRWISGFGVGFIEAVNGTSVSGGCSTGHSCSDVPAGCVPCDAGGTCSSTTVAGYVAMLEVDKPGAQRTAQIDFDLQEHFEGTPEHATVLSVIHPNCHAAYEAFVYRVDGVYYLNVGLVQSAFSPVGYEGEFPECTGNISNFGAHQALTVNPIVPHPNIVPPFTYRLKISTTPSGSTIVLGGTYTHKPSGGMVNVSKTVPTATWYNVPEQGQRFGIGSINPDPSWRTRYDDFVATHETPGC